VNTTPDIFAVASDKKSTIDGLVPRTPIDTITAAGADSSSSDPIGGAQLS